MKQSLIRRLNPAALCAAIILLLFITMYLLNYLTPLIADDYVYSMRDYAGESKLSFYGLIKMQYLHLNGRVLLHALLGGALLLPRWLFAVLNAGVFCILTMLLVKHTRIGRDPVFLLFGIIMCWFFLPVIGETVLWTTGACNYLWGTVIVLIFLLPYTDALFGRVKYGKAPALRCALLGLIAGATNENTAGAAILFCCLTLLLLFWEARYGADKPRKIPLWTLTGIAGAVVGYCVMLFAPANFTRLANTGSVSLTDRITVLSSVAERLYFWPSLIYVCLLTLTLLLSKKPALRQSLPSIFFALCGCAAGVVMLLPSQAPDRAFFGGIVFMIAAILIQVKILMDSSGKTSLTLLPLLCVATAAFTMSVSIAGLHLRTIKRLTDNRDTYVREQIELGERDVVTFRFYAQTRYSAFSTVGDLPSDPSTWKNQAIANYYRLNTIRSEEIRYSP